MKILLATNNPHKTIEIAAILTDVEGVEIMTLRDLPNPPREPIEDGDSLEANAFIKASEIYNATGITTIADDTGLEVDALQGAPGVRSARYAGESASYDDNCRKLLDALADTPDDQRTARFRTVICYHDGTLTQFAEGEVRGTIERSRKGENGFGYDSLFRPEGSDRTFAEMSAGEKNSVSHRAKALEHLRKIIAPYLAYISKSSNG